MIKEFDLFGVFLPPMLVYMLAATVFWLLIRKGLALAGFYRFVWHPALFNAALYALILASFVVAIFR